MAYAWLLVLLPFAGATWLALEGRRLSERRIGEIACGAIAGAFVVAVLVALTVLGRGGEAIVVGGPVWMAVGGLEVGFRLLLDPLSALMAVMVTGVALLIHLYSRGYMHGDPHFARFFALLNLFVGAMLTLVLGDNLAVMFIGWEGVGFCSYMLIGYFTEKWSAAQAGKKAFLVNRVGDLGFLLGAFLCWNTFGSLRFTEIAAEAARLISAGDGRVTAIALCFFVGACGKSAQFPLYVWLPDAMEGPTPVSALIHAATMVTAGVYLVVRLSVLYALAPLALNVVAVVGLLTAVLAALLALVQNDIKKVLAYSTISQLGYMFLACGVGAFAAAIFHLLTHAFFKGLLFLGSGSVIHAVEHALHGAGEHGDPQDMRNMGGLAAKLPTTHWTMLVGSAAIAGVPLLSGFFSKDEILYYAGHRSQVLLLVGLAVALLTAFYMFRLMFKTFYQPTRLSAAASAHLHESPPQITGPLVILAGLSLAGGLLNLPGHAWFSQWLAKALQPVIGFSHEVLFEHFHPEFADELRGMLISSVVALLGIALAAVAYRGGAGTMARLAQRFPGPYGALVNLYGLDEFYKKTLIRPGLAASQWLARAFDQEFIDGAVNGVGRFFADAAGVLRQYQPGFVRSYALWFSVGAAAVVGLLAMRGSPPPVAALIGLLVVGLIGGAAVVARPRDEA